MALTPEQEAGIIALLAITNKTISQLEASPALTDSMLAPVENSTGTFAASMSKFKDYFLNQKASTTIEGVVELLTNAELASGTDTTRVPTASNLLSLFTASSLSAGTISSIVSNGASFDKFHIRAKKQITTIPAGGAGQTITFASAFPNACLAVVVTPADWSGANPAIAQMFVASKTTTNFIVSNTDGDTNVTAFEYIAIGY